MLVVISDLHFVDGTAGKHDVPTSAFDDVFISDIVALAEHAKATEIKLLLLGDIIDLLRTTYWFGTNVQAEDKPWGENGRQDPQHFDPGKGSETERHCHKILDGIVSRNKPTFDLFANLGSQFGGLTVKVVFIPGNHDRLVNCYPSLRDRVANLLKLTIDETTVSGLPGSGWRYKTVFEDETYSVFARHGHEFDTFNFGGRNKDDVDGHLNVSIGDVVTTEIAAQLAHLLIPKLDHIIDDEEEKAETRELIYQIDNVRPWTSIAGYLKSQFGMKPKVWGAIVETFADITANLLRIKFFREWFLVNQPSLIANLWHWLDGHVESPVSESVSGDSYAQAALADYEEKNSRFVLYGHTHSPEQVPLDSLHNAPEVYINTGTWRTRVMRTIGHSIKYANLKTMTYALFYNADEDKSHKQPNTVSFDVWTGWESKSRPDGS